MSKDDIKIGDWVLVRKSNLFFKVAKVNARMDDYKTTFEYFSENELLVFEREKLLKIENANHLRNMFYNAQLGTLENEIANKLNKLETIEKDLKLYKKFFDKTVNEVTKISQAFFNSFGGGGFISNVLEIEKLYTQIKELADDTD